MLQPGALAYSRYRKAFAMRTYVTRDICSASVLHATGIHEAAVLRDKGFTNPIAVIGNGIDTSECCRSWIDTDSVEHWPWLQGRRVVLFLSRVHPIKGIMDLIRAWAVIAGEFPEWHLVIAGPGSRKHIKEVEVAIRANRVGERVSIVGPLYGKRKHEMFAVCEFCVLPSYSENFGNVVVEALASGRPVITTTRTPWEGLQRFRCGWWIEPGAESLATTLREAMALPSWQTAEMGTRGRSFAEKEYDICVVAVRMIEVYRWCMGGDTLP
jgi:glycosyltransferase involved in cell wall biosynthesis